MRLCRGFSGSGVQGKVSRVPEGQESQLEARAQLVHELLRLLARQRWGSLLLLALAPTTARPIKADISAHGLPDLKTSIS